PRMTPTPGAKDRPSENPAVTLPAATTHAASIAEEAGQPKVEVKDLNVYFRTNHAIRHVSLSVQPQTVLAVIGPSGCGKSTFIRALDRMHGLVPATRAER